MGGLAKLRVGRFSVGLLGGLVLVQACGRHPTLFHGVDSAGAPSAGGDDTEPQAGAGESAGGTENAGGAESAGGAGASDVEDAGAAGAAPEPHRSITARFIDEAQQPVPKVKLYIAGKRFVSGADGIAHAEGPVGAYDALLNDDVSSNPDQVAGVHLYEGLTTSEPLFKLYRGINDDMTPAERITVSGALSGAYPAGSVPQFHFDTASPFFQTTYYGHFVEAGYTIGTDWYSPNVTASGVLGVLVYSQRRMAEGSKRVVGRVLQRVFQHG